MSAGRTPGTGGAARTDSAQAGPSALVELRGVSKSWGERHVLRDVSFVFRAGETWVISGRSGTGKSTLLNLVAGYVEPDAGEIVRPARVGYLLQDDILMSGLTASQNVRVAGAAAPSVDLDDRVRRALDAVGIGHRADVPVEYLSGGERRRVEFASLLVGDLPVVLFDEPTASLDPQTRGEVADTINAVFSEKLCIVVSHDESFQHELSDAWGLRLREGTLSDR